MAAAAFPIFVLTISLALTRPRIWRLRIGPATAAIIGASLTVVLGAVSPAGAYQALVLLYQPAVAIISLMVLTLIAEQAGLFDRLAFYIGRLADGDGRRLFAYIFFAGTIAGSIFTNDAAVLIFTPLVFKLIDTVGDESWTLASKMPYYFAVLYVANLVGAFVISNPINIIVASFFNIEFPEYARWMVFPALVSVVVTYLGLKMFFGKAIPPSYDRFKLRRTVAPRRRGPMIVTAILLCVTLAGFFMERVLDIPIWLIAFLGAATLLLLSRLVGGVDVVQTLKGVGWDVIIFVIGIFVVVTGLRNAGLTYQIERLIIYLGGSDLFNLTAATGLVASVCSALMNNHPTAYALALAIEDMPLDPDIADPEKWMTKKMLVFAALIGGDLGPKMLPIGSLAAMLWFRMLRDRGVEIPYSLYIKIGIPVTLAAVLLSVLALNLEIILARLFFLAR